MSGRSEAPAKGGQRVTLHDVAARAGVSVSTVSRVVTGAVVVDPATAERVREAIADLGYRPNLLARSFRRRETYTIGLLVPDNSNPFFAEVSRAIENAGYAEGYSVVLCNSDLSAEKQAAYIDVLLAKQVDGLILASSGLIDDADGAGETGELGKIRAAGVPCVVVDRNLGDAPIDQVLIDNVLGGWLAGDHLARLGHRRIACIAGPHDLTPSAGRVSGFRQALAEHGLAIDPGLLLRGNGRTDGGTLAARRLLDAGADFTAVFAFNDQMAAGAIATFLRAGCRIPDDVSVIGFDDIPQAAATFPALTTVAQPTEEMGALGVRLLLERIARPDAPWQRVMLPTRLVVRESTGPPRAGG